MAVRGRFLYRLAARSKETENTLEDKEGKKVKLKPNAEVDVTIEADANDTTPQDQDTTQKK